ncbi:CpsB/CapC family capsule biosynthesis tyrosine phosphatase [Neobacillus drentensis]|uniref:tyrosine-protein phosphatase n=1 Tax=Neobacillus drentensis TaxID=220684 RepID=UPI002FFEE63D
MIDIHCHILPGVDDGAEDVAESLEMAKRAVEDGINTIIATPHHKNNKYENTKIQIIDKVNLLNDALIKEGINLKILHGQENRIYGEILDDFDNGEILPLVESKYLFIEFPSGHVPRYTERLFYDIQLRGLIPIVVHPERNQEIMERPDVLYNLVEKGALTQVTASSICGYFGKNIKNFSHQLIEANLTHFVASDAHNIHNRSFKMQETFELIEKKYGTNLVYLYKENSELLVENKNIYKEAPVKVKNKKRFMFF